MLRIAFYSLLLGELLLLLGAGGVIWYIVPQLPSVESLREVQLQTPLKVYSADGRLIAEFGAKRRQPVAIDYGPIAEEIAWIGEEAAGTNAKRVLSRRGTIPVTLRFLEPVDPRAAGERKTLAARAQAEVEAALGASEAAAPILYTAQ